jgi:hypothetical protein
MRTAEPLTETSQVHRFSENLMIPLAKGKEWATPGVQAALQRAVAGLDTGIETASPRLQEVLRRLADELAGGVETLTPRVQDRLKRVAPKAAAEVVPAEAGWPASRKWWLIAGLLAVAATGLGLWRSMQRSSAEPVPSAPAPAQAPASAGPDADPDLAAGRM